MTKKTAPPTGVDGNPTTSGHHYEPCLYGFSIATVHPNVVYFLAGSFYWRDEGSQRRHSWPLTISAFSVPGPRARSSPRLKAQLYGGLITAVDTNKPGVIYYLAFLKLTFNLFQIVTIIVHLKRY